MELLDRLLSVVVGRHFDKGKTARATGCLIAHDTNIVDGSRAAEELRQSSSVHLYGGSHVDLRPIAARPSRALFHRGRERVGARAP